MASRRQASSTRNVWSEIPGALTPFLMGALGVAVSVGVAYATIGNGIRTNTRDIVLLQQVTKDIGELQIRQATADAERGALENRVDRMLRILERRFPDDGG